MKKTCKYLKSIVLKVLNNGSMYINNCSLYIVFMLYLMLFILNVLYVYMCVYHEETSTFVLQPKITNKWTLNLEHLFGIF